MKQWKVNVLNALEVCVCAAPRAAFEESCRVCVCVLGIFTPLYRR